MDLLLLRSEGAEAELKRPSGIASEGGHSIFRLNIQSAIAYKPQLFELDSPGVEIGKLKMWHALGEVEDPSCSGA